MPARVEIISGPTCCGKSYYIAHQKPEHDEVLFLDELDRTTIRPDCRYLLHYNLLRPYDQPRLRVTKLKDYKARAQRAVRDWRVSRGTNPFSTEQAMGRLLASGVEAHAIIMVAPRSVLLARASERTEQEVLISRFRGRRYDRDRWARVYASVDLIQVYRLWFAFLKDRKVAYDVIHSATPDYQAIRSDEEALAVVAS